MSKPSAKQFGGLLITLSVTALTVIWLGGILPQSGGASRASNFSLPQSDCSYGPDTCKPGFVWREAAAGDHVCVAPAVREQTKEENYLAAERRQGSGAYGADTCKQGYVWREAFAGDRVCVKPESRSQAARDNQAAAERRACRNDFQVTNVFLKADNPHSTGSCPVTVRFRGSITANGAGTVKYIFTRSDGAESQPQQLYFERAGTKEISEEWTLGGAGLQRFAGWVNVKIISPNEINSYRGSGTAGEFSMTCNRPGNAESSRNDSSGNNRNDRVYTVVNGVLGIFDGARRNSPGANQRFIACPIEQVRSEITTPLPSPWWNTPWVSRLERTHVQLIDGRRTLVCEYSLSGRTVSIMREFPEGISDCRVHDGGFMCG